jgi:hypothetical protein
MLKVLFFKSSLSRNMKRVLSRPASSSAAEAFSRKELIPLIRRVHPDLFHSESDDVRDGNLHCIQDLYEIFDFLGAYNKSIKETHSTERISPLQECYDFHFYLRKENEDVDTRQTGDESGSKKTHAQDGKCGHDLVAVQVSIKPPSALCDRSAGAHLSIPLKKQAIATLQSQVSQIFTQASMPLPSSWPDAHIAGSMTDPWVDDDTTGGRVRTNRRNESYEERGKRMGVDLAAIDRIIVDRYLQQSIYVARGGTVHEREQWLQAQVHTFVRSGHILLRGVSMDNEKEAIQKISQFLCDHGHAVNFSCAAWKAVIIILTGSEGDSSDKGIAGGRKKRNMQTAYTCSLVGTADARHAILEFPWDFRSKMLMECLGDLPQARDPSFQR